MKRLAFIALLLPLQVHAADPANVRAEREARQFLSPCKQQKADDKTRCLTNQRDFIEQYVYAKAGDLFAMQVTADGFHSTATDPTFVALHLGLPENLIQSCAWLITRSESTRGDRSPEMYRVKATCSGISPNELIAITDRAAILLQELRVAPASMPADDWEPAMPGLKRTPPVAPRCLDSTVHALRPDGAAADDGPKFVPPKGCPTGS